MERKLILPYSSSEEIKKIKAGDSVLISGTLYVGRADGIRCIRGSVP